MASGALSAIRIHVLDRELALSEVQSETLTHVLYRFDRMAYCNEFKQPRFVFHGNRSD
jgi:hypothetical protein